MRTRLVRFICRLTVAVSLIAAGAGSLTAQQATISGTVRDASTATPIHGAVVSLGTADDAPLARTDANGSFTFRGVQDGEYQLVARRLGYEPARITVLVHEGLAPVSIPLRRIATLDTVRVRAARQGIFGVVGTARGLKPPPGAVIQVLGESSRRALADSAGHFFVPIKTPGTYVVRASVPAYEPRTISVTVRPDQGAEVAMLLDTASGRSTAVLAHAYACASVSCNARSPVR